MKIIERKFLIKRLPNISNLTPLHYERYILPLISSKERRIQHIDNQYELDEVEIITTGPVLIRKLVKRIINYKEFKELAEQSIGEINRDSYLLSKNPNLTLKIYEGLYKGLVRVEVKFESEEEAKSFKPLDWFGLEITELSLGRDSQLVRLSQEDFKRLLSNIIK